jgi:GMP synthase-like glutamine amidotransferase
MTDLDGRPNWIIKEEIFLEQAFLELPYVKKIIGGLSESEMDKLRPMVIQVVHGDQVTRLPNFGKLYAYSERTRVEMWGVEDRILAT